MTRHLTPPQRETLLAASGVGQRVRGRPITMRHLQARGLVGQPIQAPEPYTEFNDAPITAAGMAVVNEILHEAMSDWPEL